MAVKNLFGKTLFTLLTISNLANLTVVSAKCLEGFFFPVLATQDYRWSSSLMFFAVEICLSVPVLLYMKMVIVPAVKSESSGLEWRYLWLIPATFYLIWCYLLYGNSSHSSLEIALQPKNTLFLFAINIGAFLIYYVVARLILEQNKSLELRDKNHQLIMQAMQYKNLQEKITDARRAKPGVVLLAPFTCCPYIYSFKLITSFLAKKKTQAIFYDSRLTSLTIFYFYQLPARLVTGNSYA